MEFKVGDRAECISASCNFDKGEQVIVTKIRDDENGRKTFEVSSDRKKEIHQYQDAYKLIESSNTLQTTKMEKIVYNVLVVNKRTSNVEKDETVVASNEKEAILRAYGVTERSKFIEDKPQQVVMEKEKKGE